MSSIWTHKVSGDRHWLHEITNTTIPIITVRYIYGFLIYPDDFYVWGVFSNKSHTPYQIIPAHDSRIPLTTPPPPAARLHGHVSLMLIVLSCLYLVRISKTRWTIWWMAYPTIPVIIRFDYSVINYDQAFDNPFILETYLIIYCTKDLYPWLYWYNM